MARLEDYSFGRIVVDGEEHTRDLIVTPDRVVRCARPKGWHLPRLQWDQLTDGKIAAIPLLTRMRPTA